LRASALLEEQQQQQGRARAQQQAWVRFLQRRLLLLLRGFQEGLIEGS
jgi:hypothetical protein